MPRGDRTGPNGAGAMSGRRMGLCIGNNIPGFQTDESNSRGRGGFGFRHGLRRDGNQGFGVRQLTDGFRYAKDLYPNEPIDKKALLEEQMENLKKQLNELENQFKNLA